MYLIKVVPWGQNKIYWTILTKPNLPKKSTKLNLRRCLKCKEPCIPNQIFAGAAHRAGPDSMFILCKFVSVRQFLGLWLVKNWRRRQTLYDVARLLLMILIEPWRNSTPFFGAEAFCTTKFDDFSTMPHSGLKWNSMASSKRYLHKY